MSWIDVPRVASHSMARDSPDRGDSESAATRGVIRRATFDELDASTLYDLIRLRVDVFVVEQHCPYPELDGRDTEPSAVHWWIEDAGTPVASLRQLAEPDGSTRIGRVVTAPSARGNGLAATLIDAALTTIDGPVVIDAQAHLARWYWRFGFEIVGDVFIEDGIDHLPMRRA
jgi:ElaA protein